MKAYISQNADKKITDALTKRGFEVILLPPFPALSHPVDTHADMLMFVSDGRLFVHRDYEMEFEGFGQIVRIDEPMGDKYPQDILLNIALIGDTVLAKTTHISKTVLNYLASTGRRIRHVSQGYAHCSVCRVSDGAYITADRGIAEIAHGAGLEVLLISEGGISLPPYKYGFIGGACGSTLDEIFFAGTLSSHPDGERIRTFCKKHGKTVTELADIPLSDVGGILFV